MFLMFSDRRSVVCSLGQVLAEGLIEVVTRWTAKKKQKNPGLARVCLSSTIPEMRWLETSRD